MPMLELIGIGLKVATLTMHAGQFTALSQKIGRRCGLNERDGLGWRCTLRLVRGMTEARHPEHDEDRGGMSQTFQNPIRKP